jgi:predicted alpha/beta-fold hydrolase
MTVSSSSQDRLSALLGHFYTIAPVARHTLRPRPVSSSAAFRVIVQDPDIGAVRLSGRLHHAPSDTLLVVVHGLGGDVGSHYVLDAAAAGDAAGVAVLRIHLRGADRTGEDLYHAGMSHDVHAILASPHLERYSRIVLVGYSLGGHIVLRAATETQLDSRVTAVAAVCPPLDLARGADAIDQPVRFMYRRHILESIKDVYAAVARRRSMPLTLPETRRIKTLREWDERVIAPRFGFRGANHYYTEMSVDSRLSLLSVPTLLIAARHDPMIPASTVAHVLESAAPNLDVRWMNRGGHVGFPADVDIGESAAGYLEPQVVAWLLRQEKRAVTIPKMTTTP